MHNDSKHRVTFTLILALAALVGCSSGGPTASSSLGIRSGGALGPRALVDEQFNCQSIGEVHVRFSEPGPISESATMLFNYGAVPDGSYALHVIWDEDNNPTKREEVELSNAAAPHEELGVFNIIGKTKHVYPSVIFDTTRTARVELTANGLTGNCSTVRRIVQKADLQPRCATFGIGIPIPKGCPK